MIPVGNQQPVTANRRVLLLGDDGRMETMLRDYLQLSQVVCEPSVMEGIARLGTQPFEVVLVNAEPLKYKTTQAVRALRQTRSQGRIYLFGDAFAEIYVHDSLTQGADDFLVWPIPPTELREKIIGRHAADRTRGPVEAAPEKAFAVTQQQLWLCYQTLAKAVPQGHLVLIEQAEKLFAELLQTQWVRVETGAASPPLADLYLTIPLTGLNKVVGRLLVGPGLNNQKPAQELAQAAASYLGTLLMLARRDEHLKRLATIDELTGAYNRRYFEHFTRQILRQSQSERTEVTLLVFDIDEFKHFNDTYGHAAGDEILREAIRLMKRCCRAHDVVARIGGDEFAVLFWDAGQKREKFVQPDYPTTAEAQTASGSPGAKAPRSSHPEMVLFMSNRFRRLMLTNEFPCLGSEARGVLTISGGVAGFPWDGDTVETLLAKADEALLSAKRAGKNRITLVGQSTDETT